MTDLDALAALVGGFNHLLAGGFAALGCLCVAEQKEHPTGWAFCAGLAGGFMGGFMGGCLAALIYAGLPDLRARRIASRGAALIAMEVSLMSGKTILPPDEFNDEWRVEDFADGEGEGEGEDSETKPKPKAKPAKFEFPDGDWDRPSHRGRL